MVSPTTPLFAVLGLATAAVAVSAALAGHWVPAVGAGLVAGWFATMVAGRRRR